jgi:RNA polymerase sigma-B factor
MDDLRQVAQLALVKAVDRFDPSFGVQFSTFAGRTIDGELKRHFRDKTWAVRVPRSLQEISLTVRRAADEYATANGRAPNVDELAAATGFDVDQVLEALDAGTAYNAQSLDRPVGNGEDGSSLGASLGAVDARFERTEVAVAVEALLETLPEREQTILRLRFFEDLSQSEIGDRMGISQMHVSRLLRRSLEQLRAYLR